MQNPIDNITSKLAPLRALPRDRYEAGRSQRDSVPLESHAEVVADADRTEKDHAQLSEAIDDGMIEVVRDI